MAFKSQSEDQSAMSEINVTPLVDVMLVLVIILLVTAPLLTQSVQVKLPKTTETIADTQAQPLQLGIDAQGTITLNKNLISDLATLETALKAEQSKNSEVNVNLYADQAVIYSKVAEVIATISHSGISKIGFESIEQ
ncbi:MAG: biopolymer transporter ExbD [Methylococcaceae bacterium]|nr:biopolymer transporter ExbD [Methylococcaceae bacterium]